MLKTRFQGPFAPTEVADSPSAFGSRAFPEVQQDKVRRADDWRRSGHNSTVFVLDSPPYAGTQRVLTSVQAAAQYGPPVLAALDHDGACRALPVRNPDECFVFVPSEEGPQVFQHLVHPFGGTGSVWAYLRVADVICLITLVTYWHIFPPHILWTMSISASLSRPPNLPSNVSACCSPC